jgi:hypothetical protein
MGESLPTSESPLAGRHIYICLPTYDARVDLVTLHSVIETSADLSARGVTVTWDSIVDFTARGRNTALARFWRNPAYTDFMMADTDEGWENDAVARLMMRPVDCVAGLVRARADPEHYPMRWRNDLRFIVALDPATGLPSEDGLIEIDGGGNGFFRLSRECVSMMIAAYPEREYDFHLAPGGVAWDLFAQGLHERGYWDEGLAFFRLWRAIGGRVFIDPKLKFCHAGRKVFGPSSVGDWLRNRKPEDFIGGPLDGEPTAEAAE